MRIDQVVVGAAEGDAITESAMRLQRALQRIATSEIFAVHFDRLSLTGRVNPIAEMPPASSSNITILHVSIGEPELQHLLMRRPGRLILYYHNISPANYFEPLDPRFATLLRRGRWELHELVGHADGAIAASAYNASELHALGMSNVLVAPPALNIGRLHDVEPDPATMTDLRQIDGPIVLVIGQLLPHKRPDLAIATHHFLTTNHIPNAHLAVVGPHRNMQYSSALIRHAESLGLSSVHIPGGVSDEVLSAYLRNADVLLVPSEHEGFCVPIVEAMSFGVPVVTRDFGAIAETAAGAAMMLPSTSLAPELSEALARVLSDPSVTAELVARGLARSDELTPAKTLRSCLEALHRVIRCSGPVMAAG